MGLDLAPDSPRPALDVAPTIAPATTPGVADSADTLALRDIDRSLTAVMTSVYGNDVDGARQRIDAAVERDGPGAYSRLAANPGDFGAVVDPARSRQLADGLQERGNLQAYMANAALQDRQVELAPLRINASVEVPSGVVQDLADRTPTFELDGPKGKATVTLPAHTAKSLEFLVRAGYSQQGAITAREQSIARFGDETPRTSEHTRTEGQRRSTTDSSELSVGASVAKDGPSANVGNTSGQSRTKEDSTDLSRKDGNDLTTTKDDQRDLDTSARVYVNNMVTKVFSDPSVKHYRDANGQDNVVLKGALAEGGSTTVAFSRKNLTEHFTSVYDGAKRQAYVDFGGR